MKQKEIPLAISSAIGLSEEDREKVLDLMYLYQKKLTRNLLRDRYYEMKHKPKDLGISVPPNLKNLQQVVGWCAKAVDTLANRSIFDGFTSSDEATTQKLQVLCQRSSLFRKYRKTVRSELKHSCAFMTVTTGDDGHPQINAFPATASSALWDSRLCRITSGMVVVDRDNSRRGLGTPTWIDVFTETAVIEIKRVDDMHWVAEYHEHDMGRCLMEAFVYNATLDRPMGTSRISRAVMNITDSAMRASVRSEISAEFFTSPQKYLLGADKEALNGQSKWDAYIGNLFCVSRTDEDSVPQFGQLSQGSMQPHIDYIRSLAMRFSGETNIPVGELGVIHDNPTGAESIYAQKEPLVIDAQNLNADNNEALTNIALMALAIEEGSNFDTVLDKGFNIHTKFKNPALPSIVTQADAMIKACNVLPFLSDSDVALEELGFSDEKIQRLEPVRRKFQAQQLLQTRYNELLKAGGNDKQEVS